MINNESIQQGLNALAQVDADVALALKTYGYPEPRVRDKGFSSLFSIVVSQQLSVHAARAIMNRANDLFEHDITVSKVSVCSDDVLKGLGLSKQKVNYVNGLSQAVLDKDIDLDALEILNDDDAAKEITKLKGFGPWSAEIYLMFSLQREDIFPSGDLALQIAIQKLKGLEDKPSAKEAAQLIQHWSPYRTIGSLFLWHYYKRPLHKTKTHKND